MRPDSDTKSLPPTVEAGVQRVLASLGPLCDEIFELAQKVSPEIAAQPPAVLADMRRWQRWLVSVGLTAVLSERPFDEQLGADIMATALRRGEQGVSLSATLTAGDAALRLVTDRLIGELGPEPSGADLAFVNARMLEFLRVLSVFSAGSQGGLTPAEDRISLCAELLRSPTTAHAARAGVVLPLRHVVALPAGTDVAKLLELHPGALAAEWESCVILASAVPLVVSLGVHGTATVGESLPRALSSARRALGLASATGQLCLDGAEAALLGAVLEIPREQAADGVAACFGALAESPRGEELLDSLSALLTFGQVALTARRTHVHRQTLLYRLKRLEELTALDLGDPLVRLRCQLALLTLERWPYRG